MAGSFCGVGARRVLVEAEVHGAGALLHVLHMALDHVPGETRPRHAGTEFIENGTDESPNILQSADHVALPVADRHLAVGGVDALDGSRAGPARHVLGVRGPVDLDHVADVEPSHS